MTKTNYGKLTTTLIAAWFIFSLAASAAHLFQSDPSRPPISLGLAATVPILLFMLWYALSEPFRQFTLALNPRTLTIVHAWRTVGYVFLVLYSFGILPGMFALPAGWGDIVIGATAPFVALKLADPDHRRSFILWQALGIADLVTALFTGATARFIAPHGIPTDAMAALPLSLIPTFAVPLLLIFHIICIAQAKRWRQQKYAHIGAELSSSAI
jgi:hypothetical protein